MNLGCTRRVHVAAMHILSRKAPRRVADLLIALEVACLRSRHGWTQFDCETSFLANYAGHHEALGVRTERGGSGAVESNLVRERQR